MVKQKHYMDIERLKPSFIEGFEVGDDIVIQEKIDGANFSIRYDKEDNSVKAFSRKKELNFSNNLRGAWEWSQKLSVDLIKNGLGDNLVLFGEWLVPHTVKYPDDKYQNAYFFDVYNTETEEYLIQDKVKKIISDLNLNYVPVFYIGKFISWDNVKSYIGKTEMGGEYGEGVVVKNQTKLNNPNTRLPFYTKIVCESFCETKAHNHNKVVDMGKMAKREKAIALTETIVTKARITKLINKMVDEGIIREDWDAHDMSTIAKNLGKAVYYDCQKEEPDIVDEIGEGFGKYASSTAMKLTREILKEKEMLI